MAVKDASRREVRTGSLGIVVITMDRSTELSHTLRMLEALPEPPPIVVVDNGSRDGTPALVRASHPGVQLIALASNRGAAARNVGVRHLGTEYVAFVDDDTWPEPSALRRASDLLDEWPFVAVVTGHVVVGPACRVDPVCDLMRASPLATPRGMPGRAVAGFLAGASVVRAEPFLAAGGFSFDAGIGGEEQLLAYDLLDAGWAILYAPDVLVHHHPSPVRDRDARQRMLARNRVSVAWLRRGWSDAIAITVDEIRRCGTGRRRAQLMVDGLALLPTLHRRRRRVSHATEQALRDVEAAAAQLARRPR